MKMKYNRIDITIRLDIISSLLTSRARFFCFFFIATLFHSGVHFFLFQFKALPNRITQLAILYPELSFPLRSTLSLSTLILQDFCNI